MIPGGVADDWKNSPAAASAAAVAAVAAARIPSEDDDDDDDVDEDEDEQDNAGPMVWAYRVVLFARILSFAITLDCTIFIDSILIYAQLQLFVKQQSGRQTVLDIASTATVAELKTMLTAQTQIPADRQRLIRGPTPSTRPQPLDDNQRTLADYEVIDKAIIFLVVKTGGGG